MILAYALPSGDEEGILESFSDSFFHSCMGYNAKHPSNPLVRTDSFPSCFLIFEGIANRRFSSMVCLYSPINIGVIHRFIHNFPLMFTISYINTPVNHWYTLFK